MNVQSRNAERELIFLMVELTGLVERVVTEVFFDRNKCTSTAMKRIAVLFISVMHLNSINQLITGYSCQHLLRNLAVFLILQYHLLCTIMCYLLFDEVMIRIVFSQMAVFTYSRSSSPYLQLHRFPLFGFC